MEMEMEQQELRERNTTRVLVDEEVVVLIGT